jgi:hypothetical protein
METTADLLRMHRHYIAWIKVWHNVAMTENFSKKNCKFKNKYHQNEQESTKNLLPISFGSDKKQKSYDFFL